MISRPFPRFLLLVGSCFAAFYVHCLWVQAKPNWFRPEALLFQTLAVGLSFLLAKLLRHEKPTNFSTILETQWTSLCFTLTLLFLLICFLANQLILQRFMNSADEFSCYFFAKCLLAGKLWATPHMIPEFFSVTHIGEVGDKWFSVYPPGWPILWAPWIKLGLKDAANPVYASFAFLLFLQIGSKIYGRQTAFVSSLFLLINPFFILNSAAYYSQPSCMLHLALFLYCLLLWKKSMSARWAFCAGLCLGIALTIRYLTAAVFSLPFLIGVIFLVRNKNQSLLRPLLFLISPCLVMIFLLFASHYQITGNPFNFPNHYLHAHEKLGFIAGYTPQIALSYLWARLQYLLDWTPPLFLPLLMYGLLQKIESRWDFLIRLSILSLPIGYFFYYSWGGNQYGPRYYFEVAPLMSLLVANTILKFDFNPAAKPFSAIKIGTILAILLTGVFFLIKPLADFREISLERAATYRSIESQLKKPALVFLIGFLGDKLVMASEDTVRNDPFFQDSIVYAHDLGERNAELTKYFLNHYFYIAFYDRTRHVPQIQRIFIKQNDHV